jgi:hypothetical protein
MLVCCSPLYINYVVASAFWVLAAELLCSGMREGCLVTSWAFAVSGCYSEPLEHGIYGLTGR